MPSSSLYAGGSWRTPKAVWIRVNGAWQVLKAASAMVGGVWKSFPLGVPLAPTSITAVDNSTCVSGSRHSKVDITVVNDPAMQTRIYRGPVPPTSKTLLTTLAAGVTTYSDLDALPASTDYVYYAYSYNGVSESTDYVIDTITTTNPCGP